MEKNPQNNNILYSNDWDDYSSTTIESSILSTNDILKTKLLNKKADKNMDKAVFNETECLICYEKVENNQSKVICNLCSNIFHYGCYKKFIEKNNNYNLKCFHCSTDSLTFKIKHWWNCCF